ncbi:flagellar biosynthesis protein FlhB [Phenylobacterium deserti]|uniref:Flagellar biosynthetic protein FlhB n=1 Tax=Phenylobacterium deserti TaxID=1914756 RepID=A0A328AV32_9CAUL|nr:flagellar biosynthesis protein FlhB [Phenylobacterium deserti]RAK58065.1 flagellar biosynthesis protein FlhB [Phenylobacterium deserti]
MAEENEGASKTEEPTPQKLQKAREKGDVAKTQDLSGVFVLASTAAVLTAMGGWMCRNVAIAMLPFLEHPDQYVLHGGGGLAVARKAMLACAPIMLILLVVASIAGVAGHLVQTGIMFTPDKLKPDWKKVSPMGGLKRMFGLDSLIQFARSLIKVVITAYVAWWAVKPHMSQLQNLAALDPAAILPFCVQILRRLVFAVVGLLLVVAAADWFIQKQRFMARMKMTKEEVKEDYKQTEGDPHVKAKQKQIRHEKARRRMMQAVPGATVVVMNPTHYAVALRYNQGEDAAPICVAKGLDALALKIRSVAEEAGVPVVEDPPLARALYAAVEIDDMIPPAHYEAVAKVIGFILNAGRRVASRPL